MKVNLVGVSANRQCLLCSSQNDFVARFGLLLYCDIECNCADVFSDSAVEHRLSIVYALRSNMYIALLINVTNIYIYIRAGGAGRGGGAGADAVLRDVGGGARASGAGGGEGAGSGGRGWLPG